MISDLFIDIYLNFNVSDQTERMEKLSRSELFLILLNSIKFDLKNQYVILNFRHFKREIEILKDFFFKYKRSPGEEILIPELLEILTPEKDVLGKTSYNWQKKFYKNGKEILPLTEEEAKIKRRNNIINIINK
jgi:hypothetical protein